MFKKSDLNISTQTEIVTKKILSVINIAKEYNLSRQTICLQINKYKTLDEVTNLRRTLRNRKTKADEGRLFVRKFSKERICSGVTDTCNLQYQSRLNTLRCWQSFILNK